MARQIHIDSDYTIQQWIDSQNTMSDYMGDLDEFENRFKISPLSTHPGYSDSSFVTALNYINDPWVETLRGLFGGGGAKIRAELLVDSGAFDLIRLADSTDSSAKKGLFGFQQYPQFSSDGTVEFFASDAHIRASHANGDDPTSTSIYVGAGNRWPSPDAPGIASFDFDFYVQDSAWFRNLTVKSSFIDQAKNDSSHFNRINIIDSSNIGGIIADSLGYVKIVFADIDSSATIDSARIGLLRSNVITVDSATFGNLTINTLLELDSSSGTIRFEKDSPTFDGVSKFLITDSLGPDSVNAAGVIYFGSYKLDSV